MSEIAGELARVREAFDKPTLRLLDRKWAPFVLAVFKSSFSRDRRSIQADLLHTQVDAYLADLRTVGTEVPPGKNGRALCVQWMNDQWLYRETGEGGEEQYSLTSHALEAMLLVDGHVPRPRPDQRIPPDHDRRRRAPPRHAGQPRPRGAHPSPRPGHRREDERARSARRRRRDRRRPPIEQMHEGYVDLVDLIAQLPSDFKRVEESVAGMHRQIVNDFRSEERPISEVLDEYLSKTDALDVVDRRGARLRGGVRAAAQRRAAARPEERPRDDHPAPVRPAN